MESVYVQARSQDFSWGVRTSIIGTKYFNVGMVRYASSGDTQGGVTNLGPN